MKKIFALFIVIALMFCVTSRGAAAAPNWQLFGNITWDTSQGGPRILEYAGNLYAGGKVQGASSYYLYKLNGSTWSPIVPFPGPITAMAPWFGSTPVAVATKSGTWPLVYVMDVSGTSLVDTGFPGSTGENIVSMTLYWYSGSFNLVVSSITSSYYPYVRFYNYSTGLWTTVATRIELGSYTSPPGDLLVDQNNNLYYLGKTQSGSIIGAIYKFNSVNSWTKKADLTALGSIQYGRMALRQQSDLTNSIVVSDYNGIGDVAEYDIDTGSVQKLGSPNLPIGSLGSVLACSGPGGSVFVAGTNNAQAEVWRWQESTNAWELYGNSFDNGAVVPIDPGLIFSSAANTPLFARAVSGIFKEVSGVNPCPVANNPPNVPTLNYPPDNIWVGVNPTYQASVTDSDASDTVKAYFDFSGGPTSGYGSQGATPFTSEYLPITPDGEFSWRAKGVDQLGAESSYTGYRTVRKDAVPPAATIDQENGISSDLVILVHLSEFDDRSGVVRGEVWVKINSGVWQILPPDTIDDFNYTGVNGSTYEFRYRVFDAAGNDSGFVYDGSVTIQTGGVIHGFVYDDTNTQACPFGSGDVKCTDTMACASRSITATNLGTGPNYGPIISDPVTAEYQITNVEPGSYDICLNSPSSGWSKSCPSANGRWCETVAVVFGSTINLDFGLRYSTLPWFQGSVYNGDVHSNGLIDIEMPDTLSYFVSGDGVASADDTIEPLDQASENDWTIPNYSNISWPENSLTNVGTDLSGTIKVKRYDVPLRISTSDPDWVSIFHNSGAVVIAPSITIDSSVGDDATDPLMVTNQIRAYLITGGTLTVDDSSSNNQFKLKGGIVAHDVVINRNLNNNSYPAMRVEYDPNYFLYQVPYFTLPPHRWEEVK